MFKLHLILDNLILNISYSLLVYGLICNYCFIALYWRRFSWSIRIRLAFYFLFRNRILIRNWLLLLIVCLYKGAWIGISRICFWDLWYTHLLNEVSCHLWIKNMISTRTREDVNLVKLNGWLVIILIYNKLLLVRNYYIILFNDWRPVRI